MPRRQCRVCIFARMKPREPSASPGVPCHHGSPPVLLASAGLVARCLFPLRIFWQRLNATASRPSASRNRAANLSRPARSPHRHKPPAASRHGANTGCNASHLSQPHHRLPAHKCPSTVTITRSARIPFPAPSFAVVATHLRSRYDARHASPKAASGPIASATLYISSDASAVSHQRDHAAKIITQRIFQRIPVGKTWQTYRLIVPFLANCCQVTNRHVSLII